MLMLSISKNQVFLWSVILFLLNGILKGFFLGSNSVGWDEPFSIFHSQLEINEIYKILSTGNNPPLYEIILHYWTKMFGIGEISVRLPSLIFSSLTGVLIFLIGIRFFNFRIAIGSSILFAFSNFQLFFAHEARVYALFGMLSVVSIYFFLSIINKEKIIFKHFIPLLIVNTVLIYSHYFGFAVLLVQFIFVSFIKEIRVKLLKHFTIYTFLLILLYIPNSRVVYLRFIDSTTNGTWVQAPNNINELYELFRQFLNAPVVAVASLFFIISFFIPLIFKKKNDLKINLNFKFILVAFFIPYFGFFIVSFWTPVFIDRYLIFVTVPLLLSIVVCADNFFTSIKPRIALHILLSILFIVTFKPNLSNRRPVKEVIAKINELKTDHTTVVFCPSSFIFNYAYYEDRILFQKIDHSNPYLNMTRSLEGKNIFGINSSSELSENKSDRIIYLDAGADFSFPDNGILSYLEKNYIWEESHNFPEIFKIHCYSLY